MKDSEERNYITRDKKKWYSEEYIERNFIKKSEVNKDKKNNFINKETLEEKYIPRLTVKKIIEIVIKDNRESYKMQEKLAPKERLKERIDEDKKILNLMEDWVYEDKNR